MAWLDRHKNDYSTTGLYVQGRSVDFDIRFETGTGGIGNYPTFDRKCAEDISAGTCISEKWIGENQFFLILT